MLDEKKVLGAEYRLLDEYFTYEEYQLSDGSTANGFVESWRDRGVGGVIGWFFGALLLPFSTYSRLILYYCTPFMHRSRTYKELLPTEKPRPLAITKNICALFGKDISGTDHSVKRDKPDSGPGEGCAQQAQPGRRRKRKRYRPRSKNPGAAREGAARENSVGFEDEEVKINV
jgi:hypothetical protein